MILFNRQDLEYALSTRSDGVGRHNERKAALQLAWPYAIEGFIGDDQDLNLYPEAYWEPLQLSGHSCYMGIM